MSSSLLFTLTTSGPDREASSRHVSTNTNVPDLWSGGVEGLAACARCEVRGVRCRVEVDLPMPAEQWTTAGPQEEDRLPDSRTTSGGKV